MKCASYAESFYNRVIPFTEKEESDSPVHSGLKTVGSITARAGSALLSLTEMSAVASTRLAGAPIPWCLGRKYSVINEHVLSAKATFVASLLGEDADLSEWSPASQKLGFGILATTTLASFYLFPSDNLLLLNSLLLGGAIATGLYLRYGHIEQKTTTPKATPKTEENPEEELFTPNFEQPKKSRKRDVRSIFPQKRPLPEPPVSALKSKAQEVPLLNSEEELDSVAPPEEEREETPQAPFTIPAPPTLSSLPKFTKITTPSQSPSQSDLSNQIGKLKQAKPQTPKEKPSIFANTMGKIFGKAIASKFVNTFSDSESEGENDASSDWD